MDELGAHVSVAGGIPFAPGRALDLATHNLQLFTKQPNRWKEPTVSPEVAADFQQQCAENEIRCTVSHDSYLINLASPDPVLWKRSYDSFEAELRRCCTLGLDYLVTHPGNATDGDVPSGLARNADGIGQALEAVPGPTVVLLELTAGTGNTIGASFEHLRTLIDGVPQAARSRVAVCFDTCHGFSAGYDLLNDYDGVWSAFDDILGLELLKAFHLNDSKHPFASRKDRHENLGLGSLGEEPFRRLMRDPRFTDVPKILETPKGDENAGYRQDLALLRGFRD